MKKVMSFAIAFIVLFFYLEVFADIHLSNAPQAAIFNKLGNPNKVNDLQLIQTAKSGILEAIPGKANMFKLILKNVGDYTSYFSDRPNRVTGIIPTNNFFQVWNQGKDNFNNNPPNAALESTALQSTSQINYVFELSNPIYDKSKKEISYTATLLKNQQIDSKLKNLGYTVLFIDGLTFNWNGNNT